MITGIGSGLDVLYIDTMSLDELFTLGIKPVEGLFRAGLVIVPIYDIVGQGRIDNELIFRGPSRMGTRRNTQGSPIGERSFPIADGCFDQFADTQVPNDFFGFGQQLFTIRVVTSSYG